MLFFDNIQICSHLRGSFHAHVSHLHLSISLSSFFRSLQGKLVIHAGSASVHDIILQTLQQALGQRFIGHHMFKPAASKPLPDASAAAFSSFPVDTLSLLHHLNVQLELNAKTDICLIDPIRVRQVIVNLLSNAAKFTPECVSVCLFLLCSASLIPNLLFSTLRLHLGGTITIRTSLAPRSLFPTRDPSVSPSHFGSFSSALQAFLFLPPSLLPAPVFLHLQIPVPVHSAALPNTKKKKHPRPPKSYWCRFQTQELAFAAVFYGSCSLHLNKVLQRSQNDMVCVIVSETSVLSHFLSCAQASEWVWWYALIPISFLRQHTSVAFFLCLLVLTDLSLFAEIA